MTLVIAIVMYIFTGWIIIKVIGPKINVPKEHLWGFSAALGVVISQLYIAYSFNGLSDPFAYLIAGGLSIPAYMAGANIYRRNAMKINSKKNTVLTKESSKKNKY